MIEAMRKRLVLCLLLAASLVLSQCRRMPTETEPPIDVLPSRPLSLSEQQIVSSGSAFSVNLLKAVNANAQNDNVFISPLSASMALSMTLNGAQGATRDSMRRALQLVGLDSLAMNQASQSLIALLTRLDAKVRLQIANSIWARQGFEVEPTFLNVNRVHFNAEVQALDFFNPSAVGTINEWVNRATNGIIPTIIDRINGDVVMYLINAIYFKAQWRQQFKPENTRDGEFFVTNTLRKNVKMMNRTDASLGYFVDREVQVADLPYGDSLYSMTILMPNSPTTIDAFIASLTESRLQTWLQGLRPTTMMLSLPRWKFEYENLLNGELTSMGMGIAFDERRADFRGINRNGRLFISKVKQKAFVEVNEEGTEAVAVTSVGISVTNGPPMFLANRPFLYLIRERTTGAILFVGKMTDPTVESVKHQ